MNRLFQYLSESRAEILKVSWPNRRQATRLTVAVVSFSLALAAFIGVADYAFSQVLQKVIFKI